MAVRIASRHPLGSTFKLAHQFRSFSALPPMRTAHFINNQWVESETRFSVVNPATEQAFTDVAQGTTADVDAAVKAARACFRSATWGKNSTGAQRSAILEKMGAELKAQREEFARLESMDNGKPINEARGDIDVCIDLFYYFAELAKQFDTVGPHGGTTPQKIPDDDIKSTLRKEPFGVIGAITPWNFPLMQAVVKVAPAIAAGCTMVLKPAEMCPLTCLRLGDLALAAGLPAGALNVVSGPGRSIGQHLLDHRGIDRISFTGSGTVGKLVLAAAGKRLVPASVELGGKGAIVVFDDVDIGVTVDWIMCGIFMCAGQICSATSRLLVQDTIYDKLMSRLLEEVRKVKLGEPLAEETQMGPLVSPVQLQTVSGFVDRAKAEGAKITTGGNKISPGYYYEPTVIEGLADDSEAWVDEIFGPVLAVRKFKTEGEAIAIANHTPFGLSHAVCSADEDRCSRVAEELDAGVVWKNCSNVIPVQTPFGGFKESGFGKEYGEMGLEEYVRVKAVVTVDPQYSWEWYVKK